MGGIASSVQTSREREAAAAHRQCRGLVAGAVQSVAWQHQFHPKNQWIPAINGPAVADGHLGEEVFEDSRREGAITV